MSPTQRVKSGDLSVHRQKISDVSARAAADIKKLLGIDTQGYTHNINTNGIQHILKRHGVNGQHDTTMSSDDDIARVGWVLENYDSVEMLEEDGESSLSSEFRDKENNPAPQIRYTKKINGTYYVVEAAFENNHKKLWVQTAYLTKNKEDVTQAHNAGNNANPVTTAETALASPSSNNTVPRNTGIVNNNISKNGGDNTENSVSQSGTKGITEPDISKDTRSHEERVAEIMGGKESQKVKGRKFVQSIGKALGVTVVFEDTVEKYGEWSDGYIDKNGVIHIDYNNKNPLAFLFRHEMVHYGSGSKFYNQFVNLVYNSKLFKEWLQKKTKMPEGASVDRMAAKYRTMVAESRKGVEELSETRLQEEMIADFAGSDLFTAGGSGLAAMSTEFDTKQRNVVSQYIADVISWLKKKINKVPGAENLTFELSRLEDTFNRMISDAKQNPTERELKHSRPANYNKSNQRIDKYGYMQDNNSRANKQGDLVNGFYNALSKKEWTTFYNEITKEGYLATATVGTVAPIVVNDKLIIAERLHRGTDAHDYVVIDAFQLQESYDVDTLELIKRKIEEGDLSYDKRTIHRTLSKLLERTFSSGILTRFDGDSQQYVVSSTEGANSANNYNFRGDSQEGITREGLSLRDKPGVQGNNGVLDNKSKAGLNNSAFSMPENIRRSVPVDTDTDTDIDTTADFEMLTQQFNNGDITKEAYMQQVAELYEEIVKKHGRIKPGEVGKTKHQDIPVPKRIDKKTKVQRHVRTVLEGGELTDEMVSTVKADILSGEFNYTPTSNKKNIAYAEDAVMKGAAVGIWERAINGDGLPTATDIAVGEALLKLAVERGNAAEVVKYTAELAELGTRLGQSVQALSTLKRMDGVGQLLYVKRAVDSLNRDLSKRFKGKAPVIQIDENMAMRLAESKTAEDFEITYSAIMNDIAAQVPVTFLDKWNALNLPLNSCSSVLGIQFLRVLFQAIVERFRRASHN